MDALRIEKLDLQNVGPFTDLKISFSTQPGLSLICGDNGIGKTTVLEAIAAAYTFGALSRLYGRQGADKGQVSVGFVSGQNRFGSKFQLEKFSPGVINYSHSDSVNFSQGFINVRAARDIYYQRQDAIVRDPTLEKGNIGQRVAAGLGSTEIKTWFTNRYLMRPHAKESNWTPDMFDNLETAISFFSVLDEKVTLQRVETRTFDIIVNTPNGPLPYEYLSSGFRSAYTLLLGILAEIEYRNLGVAAKDFSGVIIIDELDLHLHPTWQQRIGSVMKRAYPNAQIIASTHSPHIIQSAQAHEVIALERAYDGTVRPRPIPSSKYGYAGWTLEEVLEDVMGVTDTKTPVLRATLEDFDKALDIGDADLVVRSVKILREMLHPNNPTRKLIEIQAAPFIGAATESEYDA